jgi:hypothetical protein
MSNVNVTVQTQRIEVDPSTSSVSVTNAGPAGPPGTPGEVNLVPVIEEIDSRIGQHNQASPVHTQATSGRDFVGLFEIGLI